jgi:hypothetical protein
VMNLRHDLLVDAATELAKDKRRIKDLEALLRRWLAHYGSTNVLSDDTRNYLKE